MSEDQKKVLESQLWGIANLLRGKISADDYRDYILGFIFYKYLSEKQALYANELLVGETVIDYKKSNRPGNLSCNQRRVFVEIGLFLRTCTIVFCASSKR